MTNKMLNHKKLFIITIIASLCLILFQATSAYANGCFGQTFDDGNNDGTATYDVSHLDLDEDSCITGSGVTWPYITPFHMESYGNVSTSADPNLGDENTYVFSNDEYFDIHNISLVCGKFLMAYGGKNHYVPYVSLAYKNNFNGHELKNDIKYHVTGTVSVWLDGQVPLVEKIDREIRPGVCYGEWTDTPGFEMPTDYHNQILWACPNTDLEPSFDAVGRDGMATLVSQGKFEVHLDTITCTVVEN